MKKLAALTVAPILLLITMLPGPALVAAPAGSPAQELLDASVIIQTNFHDNGTGFVRVTRDGQVWCWTAAHVVEDAKVLNEDGSVEYPNLNALKPILDASGRYVEIAAWQAEVIRVNYTEDLALLRLHKIGRDWNPAHSIRFATSDDPPELDLPIWHVGMMGDGDRLLHVTRGYVSQREFHYPTPPFNKPLFRGTSTSRPGSSGGLVADEKGRVVGMLVMGFSGEDNCFGAIPTWRIRAWARKLGMIFAVDDAPVPSDADLKRVPIEDNS